MRFLGEEFFDFTWKIFRANGDATGSLDSIDLTAATGTAVGGGGSPGSAAGVLAAITLTAALGSANTTGVAGNAVGAMDAISLTAATGSAEGGTSVVSTGAVFSLDLVEIIEEAYERCGAELLSGYDFRTARRSLNLLFADWANRGVNLWTLESGSIPLQAGVAAYDIPDDTVDLLDMSMRTGTGSRQQDLHISRITAVAYNSIAHKNNTGRPIQIMVERGTYRPSVTVWPIPDNSSYTLVYWRMRRIKDAGTGATGHDVPFRMLPSLASGLAYYLSFKVPGGLERMVALKGVYDEDWQRASDEDRDRSTFRMVPFIGRV